MYLLSCVIKLMVKLFSFFLVDFLNYCNFPTHFCDVILTSNAFILPSVEAKAHREAYVWKIYAEFISG